jgi:hypothetical protein
MQAKKPSDLEIHEQSIKDSAIGYSSVIFFNGRNNCIRYTSLQDAQEMAARMTLAAANGRKGVVYAIDEQGRATFVSSH